MNVSVLSRLRNTCRRLGVTPTRWLLEVSVARQQMHLLEKAPEPRMPWEYENHRRYRISTSRVGTGEQMNSNCTPSGLHRIAKKFGAGWPTGVAFKSRRMIGYTWDGLPDAPITHRILWLEGLEPGRNRGGEVDSFARYIYIHGTSDEPALGRPASSGCIHVSAMDLFPLFNLLPVGTLVWIE